MPNCVSNPSAVVARGGAITPGVGDEHIEPVVVGEHAVAEAPHRRQRREVDLPQLDVAPGRRPARTGSAARSPFSRSRTASMTLAPWAASARAVSCPSPADAPVTSVCVPLRSMPSRTSSVVDCSPKLTGGTVATHGRHLVRARARGSWSLANLAPRIVAGDFAPGFYVDHFVKDMSIALEEARRMGLALPGLALAQQLYVALQAQGRGRDGTQSLVHTLRGALRCRVAGRHRVSGTAAVTVTAR